MEKLAKISNGVNYFKVFLLSFALLFVFGFALAQDVQDEIKLDEEVEAADLQVEEPRILPDNPVYFFKNWGREIQSFFAFDAVKKAELKLKFASEKLIEARKLAEIKKDSGIIKKGLDSYQTEIEKIKEAADKIKENAQDNPKVNSFLDKFTNQQLLHYKILQKLETQVPPEVLAKIKEAREKHLEKFSEVMNRLEANSEKIKERLEKQMEEIRGSQFKNFKNLDILKELEEKVPEQAKEAIQKAQENVLKRFKGDLEEMSPEDQERFKEYVEKISGAKERHMEILDNLKEELKEAGQLKETIRQSREKIIEQLRETTTERNCPVMERPTADFCKKGRVLIKKDESGCIISFDCVIPAEIETPTTKPAEIQACITLWNPVCGENGKTYSNNCFAKLAGVEIDHEGACKNIQIKEGLKRVLP